MDSHTHACMHACMPDTVAPMHALRPEQQIYDDGSTSGTPLWDLCDVDAHFVLEVG